MEFVDTHCHIHEAYKSEKETDFVAEKWNKGGFENPIELINDAVKSGVTKMICVGTTLNDSKLAIDLANKSNNCYASIGIHPHEAKHHNNLKHKNSFKNLLNSCERFHLAQEFTQEKQINVVVRGGTSHRRTSHDSQDLRKWCGRVVAIGECGLDYFYEHSSKSEQKEILEFQLELAQKYNLPVIFHVRDAFDDIWPIVDNFNGLKGVVHSFSSNINDLEQILSRGLYVGLNGIMTFTNNQEQIKAAKAVPIDNLLLETDAPFLTPSPMRSIICQPKHIRVTAEFLAELRGESLEFIARQTTINACDLFGLK